MSQKKDGIQQLLAAEKKAGDQISDARKRKAQKLKSAKKEADSEINKLKDERETNYKLYEQEELGKKGSNEAQIQVLTNQKLKEQEIMVKSNRGKAMKAIQDETFHIVVRLHQNVQLHAPV
uniref:V-type proton ATPase subunit G n=1 Tax=Arion vulgaris TaxID=1028688 RepID=A0A0B6Y8I7_9EUPU